VWGQSSRGASRADYLEVFVQELGGRGHKGVGAAGLSHPLVVRSIWPAALCEGKRGGRGKKRRENPLRSVSWS
jgi:hypothetical protein